MLLGLVVPLLGAWPAFAGGGDAPQLSVPDAIRAAWSTHAQLRAGAAEAEAIAADAEDADDARFPTLSLGAHALRTTEPVAAFGLKLDQGRIAQADFNPALLNSPDAAYSWGLSASITQPLYSGGRIDARRRATAALVEASTQTMARRKQEIAAAALEAYFGSKADELSLRFAEDQLAQARENESFVHARAEQGAMLAADASRASAFRAQAEAEQLAASERLASSRSMLSLLCGDAAETAALITPLDAGPTAIAAAPGPGIEGRPDLLAARAQVRAAGEGETIARGSLLPEVFLQLSAETARREPDRGTVWTTALLGARWQLSFGALDETRAARSRARAVEEGARWEERKAAREIAEAGRAIESAQGSVAAARDAVSASEAVRAQRLARHRQGLLTLTEVLDAETALSAARALLLRSQLHARLAVARLQLATGQPIEGVAP